MQSDPVNAVKSGVSLYRTAVRNKGHTKQNVRPTRHWRKGLQLGRTRRSGSSENPLNILTLLWPKTLTYDVRGLLS